MLQQQKKMMRATIQSQLHSMSKEKYEETSNILCQTLLKEPSIIEGKTIAVTMSSFPEVNTSPLIECLWKLGKTVVVPKCQPQTREMTFYEITSFNQVEVGYAQIKEPIPSCCKEITKADIDVCIVPGIVFDEKGYRIGFGGGYYDRFLVDFEQSTISMAFDVQVVKAVPTDQFDRKIQTLILENKVLRF